MTSPTILIIGAGVGGLVFAQGLRKRDIPFAVFEKDDRLDSRLQGYRLKISGDVASKLRTTVTAEAWAVFESTCAQTVLGETNLNAINAATSACRRVRLPPEAPLPYTADRGLLRRAFMTGIEDAVRFGKRFVSYELLDNIPGVRVLFDDGSFEVGSLLVAADGAHSAVRKQLLPHIDPIDTGIRCIYGKSPLGTELRARYPERHRRWITVVRDETPIIQTIVSGSNPVTMVCEPCYFVSRDKYPDLPPDYVHWGVMFRKELLDLTDQNMDQALKCDSPGLVLDITSEWDPSIRSLIELQDGELTHGMRVYSAPENIPEWETSDPVTVLGDAIHVMSPSGGVGAVAAIYDACLLAKIVSEESSSIDSIRRYEKGMREFAKVCIRRSGEAGARMLK